MIEQLFAERIFGIPWMAAVLIAVAVAVAYVVIDSSGISVGWRWFILRWFHSLCWLCLALAALAMAKVTPLPASWAGGIGAIGGVIYLVDLVTMLASRQAE
jgi:hypothetical protein